MLENKFFEYELKLIPKEITQIKLLASLKNDTIEDLITTITSALGISDTYELKSLDAEALTDVYHDTDQLTLYNEGNCLRVRHSGKETKITAKVNRGILDGEFKRDEYSTTCNQTELQRHINENFVDFTRTKFPHLSGKSINPIIIVKNSRRLFYMQPKFASKDSDSFKAMLSFDMFTFINAKTGKSSCEMYELEIEALNEKTIKHMPILSKHIRTVVPDCTPSFYSKYERGIQIFKLDRSKAVQWFNNWPVSASYNWIMFALALIAIAIGVVALLK